MFNRNKAVISIALAALYAVASPAGAATVEESGVEHEVNSCVAAVREQLDYSDATRVRHDVTAIERRTVGYTLKISTSLYGENEQAVIRAYAATCVVNGDNVPLSFDMKEGA
jgi:hypothetical protein